MEHNDNSLRPDEKDAAMPAAASSQKGQPSLKPKRKKHKLLCVGVLFLLAAALPIPLLMKFGVLAPLIDLGNLEFPRTPHFYVSRDGMLFDFSTLDPLITKTAITNSADFLWDVTYSKDRILDASITTSGSFVTRLKESERRGVEDYRYEKLADRELSLCFRFGAPQYHPRKSDLPFWMITFSTFSIETQDVFSKEVVSSEKLFDYQLPDERARARFILSEDKLLFEKALYSVRFYEKDDDKLNFFYPRDSFWFVKSNDQWTKIPLDFGIEGKVKVMGLEVVKEKKSILFLLSSEIGETEYKLYVSSYNYETFSVEKTIELPDNFCYDSAGIRVLSSGIRVLSGAQHFSVHRTVIDEKTGTRALNCVVFSTRDLTKVKELTVPNAKRGGWSERVVAVSPDLRYVAYGSWDFYLYDVELQQEFHLRSSLPTALKQPFSDVCRKLYDPERQCLSLQIAAELAAIYSFGFSEDSRFLSAADLLGNAYQWDVQNKKRARTITNSGY
jgi:hypothetical protein